MRNFLLTVAMAVPFAAATGSPSQAEDGGDSTPVDDDVYYECILSGGDDFWSPVEDDDIAICRLSNGWEVWCDAYDGRVGDCELVTDPPNEHPGPAGQAVGGVPGTGTAAPTVDGAAGPAAAAGGMVPLEVQR